MIWSAIILGFMGSVHCLAMCGPLVLTLNSRRRQSSLDKLFYNLGRISTYCFLGGIAGLFGTSIEWAIGQQYLSILSGILMLFGLILAWKGVPQKVFSVHKLLGIIKVRLSKMLFGQSKNMYVFGVYNGFLPCGLTYVALAAAIATGSVMQAVLYMALFGLGTSPMMWAIVSSFQRLKPHWISGSRVVTTFTWILAFLLIVRGLDLGIPYLSPEFSSEHHAPVSVCK